MSEDKMVKTDKESERMTHQELLETLNLNQEDLEPQSFHIQMEEDEILEVVDSDEFEKGVKVASYLVGLYTTLTNFGIDEITAATMVANERTQQLNIKNEKLHNENALKAKLLEELEMDSPMTIPMKK